MNFDIDSLDHDTLCAVQLELYTAAVGERRASMQDFPDRSPSGIKVLKRAIRALASGASTVTAAGVTVIV